MVRFELYAFLQQLEILITTELVHFLHILLYTFLMKLSSPAFTHSGTVPSRYTCDGERFLSPPLVISDVPEGATSLTLIMDDPDVPQAIRADGNFTHWVVFNIPPNASEIPEGAEVGTNGSNTRGEPRYAGPCPPPEYKPSTHRYFFRLYALDTKLDLPEGSTKEEIEAAMTKHVIATSELIGTYSRT